MTKNVPLSRVYSCCVHCCWLTWTPTWSRSSVSIHCVLESVYCWILRGEISLLLVFFLGICATNIGGSNFHFSYIEGAWHPHPQQRLLACVCECLHMLLLYVHVYLCVRHLSVPGKVNAAHQSSRLMGSNLSKCGNSWLHGTLERFRLTLLYLQGLFQWDSYVCDCACVCVISVCFCHCRDKPIYGSFFCYTVTAMQPQRGQTRQQYDNFIFYCLSIPFDLT